MNQDRRNRIAEMQSQIEDLQGQIEDLQGQIEDLQGQIEEQARPQNHHPKGTTMTNIPSALVPGNASHGHPSHDRTTCTRCQLSKLLWGEES